MHGMKSEIFQDALKNEVFPHSKGKGGRLGKMKKAVEKLKKKEAVQK